MRAEQGGFRADWDSAGNAITLPERFYIINGVLTQEYSKINQYRM